MSIAEIERQERAWAKRSQKAHRKALAVATGEDRRVRTFVLGCVVLTLVVAAVCWVTGIGQPRPELDTTIRSPAWYLSPFHDVQAGDCWRTYQIVRLGYPPELDEDDQDLCAVRVLKKYRDERASLTPQEAARLREWLWPQDGDRHTTRARPAAE